MLGSDTGIPRQPGVLGAEVDYSRDKFAVSSVVIH